MEAARPRAASEKLMTGTAAEDRRTELKKQAGEFAAGLVQSGMVVGLGSGSTAIHAVRKIGERIKSGDLKDVLAIATSLQTHTEARRLEIPLMNDSMPRSVDITIDGADEVDPDWNLIKGGGGALLREKIVAQSSKLMVVVVDETKLSPRLGTKFYVPVEVLRFGWESQKAFLESIGGKPAVRKDPEGNDYETDTGNLIFDCHFGPLADPNNLAIKLGARAGIVEHGLFIGLATDLVIAGANGVEHRKKEQQ
jgi:ribose 5-phosphate isomerase A